VLTVSCPFTEAEVALIRPNHVSLTWPWWRQDPDVDWMVWNGQVAITTDPDWYDYAREIWRVRPSAAELSEGGRCRVGIPPTTVHVIQVDHHDPPRETGLLPRPRTELALLLAGASEDPIAEDQGFGLDPDDEIPYAIELSFRPYAFLEAGDELADADDRAWRFDDPWHWQPFDGDPTVGPRWPLVLLTRDGSPSPDPDAAARVVSLSGAGSPEDDIARWRELTGAEPLLRALPAR
jgi:hypothetical protein